VGASGRDVAGERERGPYRALVEALPDGLVELDAEQRIVEVNQRFLDMTGFTRDELVGTLPPHPYWPPERVEAFRVGTGNAFTWTASDHNLILVRKDGTAFPVVAWVSPILGPDGTPVGVLGVVRDLPATERIEARYRALVSRSADLIVVLDGLGRITFVSPAVRSVVGYEPVVIGAEGASAVEALGFVHPDDRARARAQIERASTRTPDAADRIEIRVRHADGSWRVLEVAATDLLDDPSVEGFVFNARDVTERRAMERALRESEERFRTTVESLLDGLVIYSAVRDEQGQIVDLMTEYANEAVVRHSGVPAHEQIGRRISDLFPLFRSEPERLARYVELIETGTPIRFEVPYREGITDGLYDMQATKLGDGCVISFREITEQRKAAAVRAQLERERLLDQLRRAQRLESMGRLAAGVAHDLANSLAAIRNFATVVANGLGPDHPLVPDIDQVLVITAQAAALTEDALNLGGPGRDDSATVEPDVMVDEVLEVVQRSFDHVWLERGPERTTRVVHAPRHQLEQVLVNLLLNACDATAPGGRVTVRVLEVGGGLEPGIGLGVALEVTDTGVGMTPEVVGRAMEPFFTTKEPGQGTGLGLAAVHQIVGLLGGSVRIDSAPGRGTTVLVVLPAVAAAVVAD
jgi:PAS domain S-box-containing protein